jgi:3alpha(or 20beta)-hydroxysteroid dehydrogenase
MARSAFWWVERIRASRPSMVLMSVPRIGRRRSTHSHNYRNMVEEDMGRLAGKVLLVTGAAQGLGESVARMAVDEGANVLLVDIEDDMAKSVASDLGENGAYLHTDVRNEAAWTAAVEFAVDHFGHLDVLVNNAAILRVGTVMDISVEDVTELFEVNQLGPLLGMKAVVPAMKVAGRGSIINIGSTDAMHGKYGVIGYGATKWALRGMTKMAAQELGEFNIRVNSVHPGGIRTNMSAGLVTPGRTLTSDQAKMLWALRRFPEIEEVTRVVLFLASEEATYTTGTDITADGGATIGPRYVKI